MPHVHRNCVAMLEPRSIDRADRLVAAVAPMKAEPDRDGFSLTIRCKIKGFMHTPVLVWVYRHETSETAQGRYAGGHFFPR
jgi:hypothetical protein